MSNLYTRITQRCGELGITGYRLCKDCGISPSVITDLGKGRKKTLSADYANKIATRLNVTVGWLIGETDDKKAPASEGERISELYGEDEAELLRRYRAASDDTKNAVRAVLGLPPVSRQREKIG